MLQNRLFFALASRSGFGATISDAVARSSVVFRNSVSADRIVMAVSRLLRAVAAFVILLSFLVNRLGVAAWRLRNKFVSRFFSILALVFFVARRFRAVWSVGRTECSVKCEVWRKQWEVRSVKCGVWSAKCGVWSLSLECEARSVKCEVWSVRFGMWRKQWEVRSVKCGLWSVKCGVWSLKFGVRRVQCEVWSVETLLRLSLKKSNGCRRLARVYVMKCYQLWFPIYFGRTDAPVGDTTWHYKGRQDWIILFQKSQLNMKNTWKGGNESRRGLNARNPF